MACHDDHRAPLRTYPAGGHGPDFGCGPPSSGVELAPMHPNVLRVSEALRAQGAVGEIVELPESAPTAEAAAAQLGCPVGAIANSLVFAADDAPLLVLTSGAHRVETGKV